MQDHATVISDREGKLQVWSPGTSRLHDAATELPVMCKDGGMKTFPARFIFLRDGRDVAVGAMALYAP
jgi:hypothetical protein